MSERTYLDWNATAPLRAEARAAIAAAMELVGNPSSVHGEGRAARHHIEQSRGEVAALVGAEPRNIVFTSGGTEANALALSPWIEVDGDKAPRNRLLLSAIEHPSVRSGHRFPASEVEELPVTSDGIVDLCALERRLAALKARGERLLVSIMHANNETGVVQPIASASALVHDAGGLLHVDAVQSFGRIPCNINDLCADLMTVSGHKLGAPKGVGALIKQREGLYFSDPLLKGGGQERGSRAGTENVIGIIGFGAAAAAAARDMAADTGRVLTLRDKLEAGLKAIASKVVVFGEGTERVPNTTLFAVPETRAETLLIGLDLEGVAASSGAACSSGKVAGSHVLAAMGIPTALASGAVRVSTGSTTSDAEIDFFLKAWRKVLMGLSKGRRGLAA